MSNGSEIDVISWGFSLIVKTELAQMVHTFLLHLQAHVQQGILNWVVTPFLK